MRLTSDLRLEKKLRKWLTGNESVTNLLLQVDTGNWPQIVATSSLYRGRMEGSIVSVSVNTLTCHGAFNRLKWRRPADTYRQPAAPLLVARNINLVSLLVQILLVISVLPGPSHHQITRCSSIGSIHLNAGVPPFAIVAARVRGSPWFVSSLFCWSTIIRPPKLRTSWFPHSPLRLTVTDYYAIMGVRLSINKRTPMWAITWLLNSSLR